MKISINIQDIKNNLGSSFDKDVYNKDFKNCLEESLNNHPHLIKIINKVLCDTAYYMMSVNTEDSLKGIRFVGDKPK